MAPAGPSELYRCHARHEAQRILVAIVSSMTVVFIICQALLQVPFQPSSHRTLQQPCRRLRVLLCPFCRWVGRGPERLEVICSRVPSREVAKPGCRRIPGACIFSMTSLRGGAFQVKVVIFKSEEGVVLITNTY